ncbi:response regulator [Kineothrix sp. MB12-C1]|uniref:response regulator n=1 Tax=Kineothrix sp. MB12-C1 TaxID=3070215 RepID=UPI0027D32DD7|nr:response regulator [Kineothrix sp. MB12-C1]WMC92369.1 response regulator [Kineothrix sp. MB12-C1]
MKRVLIADDTMFMRYILKDMLVENGFEVVGEAVDGEDAIFKYKELKPDIVTMDITMPNVSGIKALQEIVNFDNRAKVVMISSMGQKELVSQAIISGAKSFIIKPFKVEHVVKILNQL